ncbi:MAG: C4-dicarboxylate ABC transporter substrate-binding protein [Sneathiella sp.]|jgi:TRAP-type C4-dicarboxylate transport system substrate-binding protein|uniref:TRAP transporter substrate-binding protein n=1 Tax=Sneathiella sp. TaxID=1964365 RepID=UPI000C69538E|nr:TRAP transporter substrate-binding protein [Sneathiella sp.]MAL80309.1 C4-dicarboxylate ABC transporter substrate-binding protein [Sneathiella sp.]|tara:strand:+ start:586 stop:1614 length:1029 start_codon:yes stop_codon:yes gene_type:complete
MKKFFGLSLMAAFAIGGAIAAQAAEVTLTVHHFLSPKAPAQTKMLEPWAQRVSEASNGRIEVKIFPSMSLGGKPPELYQQVRDGVVDIVWTLPGYTPGVFPRTEVFELPTVHKGDARATNAAIQEIFPMIAEDFKDVKPLLVHVHAGNALHTTSKKVTSLADVKGMKIRTPSRTGGWILEEWSADPVGMPLPDLPQSLSKGVVEGALVPFEIFPPMKLAELTKYSLVGGNNERFGTSTFLFAMNKDRYNKLPDDLKKVIDDSIGAAFSEEMGVAWNDVEKPGEGMQEKSGGEIIELDADAKAAFDTAGEKVVAKWIEEANSRGIDGKKLVEEARKAVAHHSN